MRKFILILLVLMTATTAVAETAWILCQPDSYVNVRTRASSRSEILGRCECGDEIEVDGKTKNGFVHCINLPLERNEGWISAGYVVYSQPEKLYELVTMESDGRVACRKTINGQRRCWVKDGDMVKVFFRSEEWSVTDRGFIKTEYID